MRILLGVVWSPQGRPWLGISVRPLLSIASLLRLRGNGNLQGYSRYSAGPVQFLFGYGYHTSSFASECVGRQKCKSYVRLD